jgi:Flp pilus assembly protein TadD
LKAGIQKARDARDKGFFPISRSILEGLLKSEPNSLELQRELINTAIKAEDFNRAEELLRARITSSEKDHRAWLTLAFCYLRLAKPVLERKSLEKALSIKFEELPARRMFELQRDAEDYTGALETVVALRALRDTDELIVAEIKLLARVGRQAESIEKSLRLMERQPVLRGVVEHWAHHYLRETSEPEIVVKELERRVQQGRSEPIFLATLGRAYVRIEQSKKAVNYLKQAVELEPTNHGWWYDLAVQQRQLGDVEGSDQSFKRALELEPLHPGTLRVFGVEHSFQYGDKYFASISRALASIGRKSKSDQAELCYAAAKAYEDVGDLDTAFEYYREGGKLQTELTPYRDSASAGLLKTLRFGMSPSTYSAIKDTRTLSDKPVFVLGMPRSGTTLIEQLISSHPDAFGAGELKVLHRVLDGINVNGSVIHTPVDPQTTLTFVPDVDLHCTKLGFLERGERYVEAIESIARLNGKENALRVVDKMPGNYFWSGLIPFILPKAKIIHTRRHPADTCLSNYRIFFPDGMPWSYDLRNLGKCYRAYHEHMQYWESNLPKGVMLSVHYEEVVANFEVMARRVIDHIGLKWNDKCLRFYETERAVRTASLGQVRKKIYKSSIGKWKKYEGYLKPLIQEISPIIKSYEQELEQLIEGNKR